MPRIHTTTITLTRAEGLRDECYSVRLVLGHHPTEPFRHLPPATEPAHLWVTADMILWQWGLTAPKGGCYDKCDFEIAWADAHSYSGRFDLVRGGKNDAGQTLAQQILHSMHVYTGRHIPEWVTRDGQQTLWNAALERYQQNGTAAAAAALLDRYQIGI